MRHRAHRWLAAVLVVATVTTVAACGRGGGLSDSTGPLVPPDGRPAGGAGAVVVAGAVQHAASARPIVEPPSGDAVPVPLPAFPRTGGERVVTAVVGGIERRWTLVVPEGTTEDQRLPLLVVLHGAGANGAAMRGLGFDRMAGPARVVLAYPDAVAGGWNDGRPGLEPLTDVPVDDLAFLRHLVRHAITEVGVDPARVAVTGHSNGALMAARAACDMADAFAAAVLVAGAGPSDVAQRCHPSRPVPLMVVFGSADTTVPYDGGAVASFAGKRRGLVAPVRDVLALWSTANGCTASEQQELVTGRHKVVRSRGTGCRADVVHVKVQGGGHEWFLPPSFDTTAEAWRFVLAHTAR